MSSPCSATGGKWHICWPAPTPFTAENFPSPPASKVWLGSTTRRSRNCQRKTASSSSKHRSPSIKSPRSRSPRAKSDNPLEPCFLITRVSPKYSVFSSIAAPTFGVRRLDTAFPSGSRGPQPPRLSSPAPSPVTLKNPSPREGARHNTRGACAPRDRFQLPLKLKSPP